MASKLIAVNDTAWLVAETARTPMQVGLLATFRVPEGEPTFVADLVRRWRTHTSFRPPYNYLFKQLPVPRWAEQPDEAIDLDYHLRHSALPAPGSQRELGVLVSRLHSAPMDRRYPLWECHVIEGLEEDRWSLYMKAHHSQVDGVGGVRLIRRMLSVDPEARDMLPFWSVGAHGPDQSGMPPRSKPTSIEKAGGPTSLAGVVESLGSGAKAGAAVAGSITRTLADTVVGSRDEDQAVQYRAPRSILNGRIHRPRRFATQHYAISRLKALAKAADGSLNDVFLAISGGALRRYLAEIGELPEASLTANVPVSVRTGEGAKVGNAVTFLFANLGTDVDDPKERFEAIRASTRRGKARLPEVGGLAMDVYTALLMGPFLGQSIAGFGGFGLPAANIVISNVPGPSEPRYVDGSLLEEMYPVSLLFNGQALNITAVSYNGEFGIGFTGCRDSIPSLQRIAVYCGEELEALEAAYGIVV